MGMPGADTKMMMAMLGASGISGLLQPEGQKRTSFAGEGDIDPRQMGHESKALMTDYLQSAIERAAEPITMKTTVNPLPMFTGGGLGGMTIGAPAMDANRLNPALRTTPGVQIQRRRLATDDPNMPMHNGTEGGDDSAKAIAALQLLTGGGGGG